MGVDTVIAETSLGELFERQAGKFSAKVALTASGCDLSYEELDERTDRIARSLVAMGVGPDVVVGVLIERSLDMICAVLGIIKAGGAYLGLEIDVPPERRSHMLEDSGAPVVIVNGRSRTAVLDGHRVLELRDGVPVAEAPEQESCSPKSTPGRPGPDSLAYVSYTSGTTGRPKAVCVPHRAVVRLVHECDYVDLSEQETILQFAPLSFDASTFEIWAPLLNGGRLVVHPAGPMVMEALAETITDHDVTTLWLTAGLFHRMVENQLGALSGVRQLIAGGDVLDPSDVNQVLGTHPGLRLINGYGPTENTTFSCCHTVRSPIPDGATVPIGVPVNGTQVYVLDDRLRQVPDGHWGELYVAGSGLAHGYLHNAALTAEKFRPAPDTLQPGARMYRTGDLCRRTADGVLEFGGRVDDQVKIRGFRVEPAELEGFLARQPGVKDVVVAVRDDVRPGERSLVAYVVPGDDQEILADLYAAAHRGLPDYLLPASIMIVFEFPLGRTGKIDKKSLPAPLRMPRSVGTEYVEPRNETERVLCSIWADVLNIDEVGVLDEFFELGGNSLLAVDLAVQMESVFGEGLTVRAMYSAPSISALCAMFEETRP